MEARIAAYLNGYQGLKQEYLMQYLRKLSAPLLELVTKQVDKRACKDRVRNMLSI